MPVTIDTDVAPDDVLGILDSSLDPDTLDDETVQQYISYAEAFVGTRLETIIKQDQIKDQRIARIVTQLAAHRSYLDLTNHIAGEFAESVSQGSASISFASPIMDTDSEAFVETIYWNNAVRLDPTTPSRLANKIRDPSVFSYR